MGNLEKIRQNIAANVETRLSMRYSFLIVIILFVITIVSFLVFLEPYLDRQKVYDQDFLISGLFFVIPFGLLLFIGKYLSKLHITGKMLKIKRLFGEGEIINVKQIERVKYFRLKNTRYHWITYQNNFNVTQKILVITTESFLWGKQPPIEDVIELATKM